MTILIRSFVRLLLFYAIIRYQIVLANSNGIEMENCSCNVNKGPCDTSCCCDADCSQEQLKQFNCNSDVEQTSETIVESKCFKKIAIHRSNSPYMVKKNDDLICVDYKKEIDTTNYDTLLDSQLNTTISSRSVNYDSGVSFSYGTQSNLSIYELGSSVYRYIETTSKAVSYALPISSFGSQICSGFQPITYLNDFTSSCDQLVTEATCLNALDTTKYVNQFCLLKYPSGLIENSNNFICCNATGSNSSWNASSCTNPLETLNLEISYRNPDGIQRCNIIFTTIAASTTIVKQTFSVRFVQEGRQTSNTKRNGNPGYLPEAAIIAGVLSGTSITVSSFTYIQASVDGTCSSSTDRPVIRFGQNVHATCLFVSTSAEMCPNISAPTNVFAPNTNSQFFVAAYGNSDSSNVNDQWLSVTMCVSEIGSSEQPVCTQGSLPAILPNQCYVRLDIQIAYANLGSVSNPQPVLGAVVFHYQRMTVNNPTSVLLTETITFQDISVKPVTQGDQLPRPNTRLPGDFFYPFYLNQATHCSSFSKIFCLLTFVLFVF